MRNAKISMVQRYAHLAPRHLRAAVNRLVPEAANRATEVGLKLDLAGSATGEAGVAR